MEPGASHARKGYFFMSFLKWFSRDEFVTPGGYRDLTRIAYPLILMSASTVVMQFADRKFLGNSSTEEMAAAMPSGILYFTLFCLFLVSANFTGTIVAQLHGTGNPKECVKAAWSGFYFSLMAGVLILTLLPVSGYFILKTSMSSDLFPYALAYFLTLTPTGLFACLSSPFFAFFSGRGQTLQVAAVNIFTCLMNILLDWIMIFGHWGCPKMGIAGAGLATSLSSLLGFLIILSMFFMVDQTVYPTRTSRSLHWMYVGKLLKFGLPSGLQVLSDVGSFTLILLLVGRLGDMALAVTTVAFSINNLSFMPLMGLSDSTAILCGQFIGRRTRKLASRIPYRSFRIATVYMLLTGAVYLIFPDFLCAMFRPNDPGTALIDFNSVAVQSRSVLALAALWNLMDMGRFIFGGALRGAGDTRAVCLINIACAWGLGVPGILYLVFCVQPSVIWIWAYLTITTTIESLLIYLRFRSGKWRRITIVPNTEEAA